MECMAVNASNASVAGVANAALNAGLRAVGWDEVNFKDSFIGQAVGGNPISSLFAGGLPALGGGLAAFEKGLGTPLAVGRRSASMSILALNIAGAGGRPLALGSTALGLKSAVGTVGRALSLGLKSTGLYLGINAGLTAIEAVYCWSR